MQKTGSSVSEIRRTIFVEVARAALEADNLAGAIEAIPYKTTPTEKPHYRESIYRERAIGAERVRLAMGMSLNPQDRPAHVTNGLTESNVAEKYYEPPLMQVIPSACDKCEENAYEVSNLCRKCVSRYCVHACPVDAVSVQKDGYAFIDREKCIRCGKCKSACPYEAIIHKTRPCAENCGVNAIESDELGRARIIPEKCVACGQCIIHCPFGAVADKSQIFQLIKALKSGKELIAEVAPAIEGQFGPNVSLGHIRSALKKFGFQEVYEVASGADFCSSAEAHEYATEVATGKKRFLLTSCCPSWIMLAKKDFKSVELGISGTLTPMVATAREIKRMHPQSSVVFIGPCAAKKLEAMREDIRSDVDFVITFEELDAMFEAKGLDPASCEEEIAEGASAAGRGFAVSGGVAAAVDECLRAYYPEVEPKYERAEGLFECRKLLMLAKLGKKDGYLLEGMGCPGGCVGGAGVNIPVGQGTGFVKKITAETTKKRPEKNLSAPKLDKN